jgi:hypothetical protein
MNILSQLKKLGKRINSDFSNINDGGCAVFAAAVIKELEEKGISAYARVCSPICEKNYGKSVTYARENSRPRSLKHGRDWNDMGVRFHHVVVEFTINGIHYFYDSDNLRRNSPRFTGYHVRKGQISPKEIQQIAHDGTVRWNDCFDRKHVPEVQKTVEEYIR